ncbi:MAG: stage V sporulation protein AD [Clostridia bacterium]|nr:stage V sporulation protein AD [Clostridia bacterium]
MQKVGENTFLLSGRVGINVRATVSGPIEGTGPLASRFDKIYADEKCGQNSWEMAEGTLLGDVLDFLLRKGDFVNSDIDMILSGDLLNQCMSTALATRDRNIPTIGLYGACSTMAESMCLAAMIMDNGGAENIVCMTSSHYCSAEKQFRFPLELGGQKPKSAQSTVTGAGGNILSLDKGKTAITAVTPGCVRDPGVTDSNNMGGAMAPAAATTIATHLRDTGRQPNYYDMIITGDLGSLGMEMCRQLTGELGYDISGQLQDAGTMVYPQEETQNTSGTSGCGCSALVLNSIVLDKMEQGKLDRVLFVGTGALHSPALLNEKQPIPVIAHAVSIERRKA